MFARGELEATSPLYLDASLLIVIIGGDTKLAADTNVAAGRADGAQPASARQRISPSRRPK